MNITSFEKPIVQIAMKIKMDLVEQIRACLKKGEPIEQILDRYAEGTYWFTEQGLTLTVAKPVDETMIAIIELLKPKPEELKK